MKITPYLASEPKTKRELAIASGYSTRDVELLIQGARLDGVPICSDSRGYFLAADATEAAQCAAALRRRAITQLLTARAMRRAARRMAAEEAHVEQPSLWQ